jgi:hypothetical protein
MRRDGRCQLWVGVVNQTETIHEKNLELLKEISPGMERVGIVHSPENVVLGGAPISSAFGDT